MNAPLPLPPEWRLLSGTVSPQRLHEPGPLPKRLRILKWGDNETSQGIIRIGLLTLAAAASWDAAGYGEIALDFNHSSVPGHESYVGEPIRIAGMGTPRVIEGDGLYLENISWTEDGRAFAGSYRDLSPAVKDQDGEVIYIHSVALARNGAVRDLHLFSARTPPPLTGAEKEVAERLGISSAAWHRHSFAVVTLNAGGMVSTASPHDGDDTQSQLRELLRALLVLPRDATDEDFVKALRDLLEARDAAQSEVSTYSARSVGAEEVVRKQLGISAEAWSRWV